jgi:hypothetical protein
VTLDRTRRKPRYITRQLYRWKATAAYLTLVGVLVLGLTLAHALGWIP